MNSDTPLVFVVDDEASIRKSLLRLFRSEGIDAEEFESARAYLDHAHHSGPSCLVLDVHMPELTGLDLQRALIESGREEQVIFISGKGDIPTCVRAMKAGAVDFLAKPLHDEEMLDAVERALTRSRRQRLRQAEERRRQAGQREAHERIASLTPREYQVFERVIAGKMNKEIAADFGTSIKTVKIQRGRVMGKMGAVSIAELVTLAQKAAN